MAPDLTTDLLTVDTVVYEPTPVFGTGFLAPFISITAVVHQPAALRDGEVPAHSLGPDTEVHAPGLTQAQSLGAQHLASTLVVHNPTIANVAQVTVALVVPLSTVVHTPANVAAPVPADLIDAGATIYSPRAFRDWGVDTDTGGGWVLDTDASGGWVTE